MNSDMQKELREYAWRYFSIHAEQRIKTFHFFILLSTVCLGAPLTVSHRDGLIGYASVLAYLLSFLSFIFWKLDLRSRELIKHAEEALVILEEKMNIQSELDEMPPRVLLFTSERWNTKRKKTYFAKSLPPEHMSFSDCFNAVFLVIGVGGFFVGCACAVLALI